MPNGRGSGSGRGRGRGGGGYSGYGSPYPPYGYGMPYPSYGYGPPPPSYGYGMPPWGTPPPMPKEAEIDMLKGQAEDLENALAEIRNRLKELEEEQE